MASIMCCTSSSMLTQDVSTVANTNPQVSVSWLGKDKHSFGSLILCKSKREREREQRPVLWNLSLFYYSASSSLTSL